MTRPDDRPGWYVTSSDWPALPYRPDYPTPDEVYDAMAGMTDDNTRVEDETGRPGAELVTCPDVYDGTGKPAVFLAGGITGCPDWQTTAVTLLPSGVVAFNPRRPAWPIDDPAAGPGQIAWEVRHLARADVVLFWFCQETVQPITLHELGVAAAGGRPMVVGADRRYPRRVDVVEQLRHARPDVVVCDSLAEVCGKAGRRAPVAYGGPLAEVGRQIAAAFAPFKLTAEKMTGRWRA